MTDLALGRVWSLGVLVRFRLSLVLLLATLAYGTVGYQLVEGWNPLDSFYMTVITLSTVGFREVNPLTAGGQIFTISVIFLGLVTVFSAVGVATELLAAGDLGKWARRRRLRKRIGQLHSHFVVCGYGRVARFTGEEFARQDIPFLVIDPDIELAPELADANIPYLSADATEEAVLLEAGIERARGLISAVDSDEANLSITITARALNPELVIVARAARLESIDKLRRAGADRVASSDALGGIWIAFLALRPAVPEFFEMVTVSPDLAFEEILVRSGSPLVGKTVRETRLAYAESVILAIRRDGDDLRPFPSDDAILAPGDLAIVAGPVGSIEAMAG